MHPHRFVHWICTTSLVLLWLSAQACSTETTLTEPNEPLPTSGSLELTIEETGARPDTDGYEVAIVRAGYSSPVDRFFASLDFEAGGGMFHLRDLAPDTYTVRVEGLAAHCSVAGPRAFTIEAGKATRLAVGIFCPGPGAILVRTATRGRDAPTAEYSLWIRGDAAIELSIGTNDSLKMEEDDLPDGEPWFLELTGVPENCRLDLPPSTVRNLNGATVRVEYVIACIPRGSKIAFEAFGGIYLTGGEDEVELGGFAAVLRGPSLAPDRSRVVASTTADPFDASPSLFLVNADGSGRTWLPSDGRLTFVGSQAWSPDGSKIVFWRQGQGASDIYVTNADGSGEVRLTFAGWNTHPAWSPDGASIAFCRVQGDPDEDWPDIYRMSAIDGSGLTRVAEAGCAPAWSPNGSRIAFTQLSFSGPADLAVIRADGSGLTKLHPGTMTPAQASRSPSWSPDGSQIAYTGGASSNRIWIVEFDGSAFGEAFPFRLGSAPSWR